MADSWLLRDKRIYCALNFHCLHFETFKGYVAIRMEFAIFIALPPSPTHFQLLNSSREVYTPFPHSSVEVADITGF